MKAGAGDAGFVSVGRESNEGDGTVENENIVGRVVVVVSDSI